jgi:hypothetical protein
MPEPTTAARSMAVPTASAITRRPKSILAADGCFAAISVCLPLLRDFPECGMLV